MLPFSRVPFESFQGMSERRPATRSAQEAVFLVQCVMHIHLNGLKGVRGGIIAILLFVDFDPFHFTVEVTLDTSVTDVGACPVTADYIVAMGY